MEIFKTVKELKEWLMEWNARDDEVIVLHHNRMELGDPGAPGPRAIFQGRRDGLS